MSITEDDKSRAAAHRAQILDLLRKGPRLNSELYTIAHNVTARVSELRDLGHDIQARHLGGGLWEYRLVAEASVTVQPAKGEHMNKKTYTIVFSGGLETLTDQTWDQVCGQLDGAAPDAPKPLVFAGAPISVKRTYEVEGPPRKKRTPKAKSVDAIPAERAEAA